MDRKLYKLAFRDTYNPSWICPTCNKGVLKIKKDTFHKAESATSKKSHADESWDPLWVTYIYSCLLLCTNKACKETVANSGRGFVDVDYSYDEEGPVEEWIELFRPKYFTPHLKIFQFPKSTPKDVSREIDKSFELFFADPSSSSTHIRIALEDLLTFLKIKRYEKKGGKQTFLSLHRRIDLLPKKHDHLKELFYAIKWLGNAGSHSTKKITEDDVLDAYEIMEEILVELFVKKSKRVKKLAKEIIKKKGPKKK